MKRKLIDLADQRKGFLQEAESALNANDQAAYDAAMEKVNGVNADITRVQNLIREQEKQLDLREQSAGAIRDMAEHYANELKEGREIVLDADLLRRGIRNADGDGTLLSGSLAQPTGVGTDIHDNLGACSLLDLVRVENMSGMSGWEEPYAISDMAVQKGVPASVGGTSRTASDPAFGLVAIKPYELTTTSFVDRNIATLSPVAYFAKIRQMALRALKNEACKLILLGDSEVTHVMYGMINGANKSGTSMVKTVSATVSTGAGKIDEGLLDEMYFAYGDDLTVGGNGMLFLNKKDLKAFGKLRGTNEKGRLFSVRPMEGDACRGILADGGMQIPYLVNGALTAVDGTAQAASSGADKLCSIYGDPMNYLLGLFSGYTIRVDESYKAQQRLHTILGDAMIGGNVVAKDGFVVSKIAKAAT